MLHPASPSDIIDALADARRTGQRLDIRGGGSKAAIGAPTEASILSMAAFHSIVDYDPSELVLTAGAATPLAEIQALVAAHNQMLAFDPFDHGTLLGSSVMSATLGGVLAAGVAGSQRLSLGGARDHLLGFEAVSGRGEHFVAGGRVVKNVTGYDLPKLACASWGRLMALTQVTIKVVPRPRQRRTMRLSGLTMLDALQAMTLAMRSAADVCAAAHLPESGETVLRLQGFGPSVEARWRDLEARLPHPVDEAPDNIWDSVRDVSPLVGAQTLWRVNVAPSQSTNVIQALESHDIGWLFDWAGGLIWLACDDAEAVRRVAAQFGGHAMLVRASEEIRAAVPTLHPEDPAVAALAQRVRRAFDPHSLFETGRF